MKKYVLIILILIVVTLTAVLLINPPGGNFTITEPAEKMESLPADKMPVMVESDVSPADLTVIYRWQNQDGSWTYSDKKPAGRTYDTYEINKSANIYNEEKIVELDQE